MLVAIQGELGSFSDEAARALAPGSRLLSCARFSDVFDALERRRAAAAVIPIENTLAGAVAENFDLLLHRRAWIAREFRLRIRHNLIAAPGVRFAQLRRVLSHPVALDQCRAFFAAHRRLDAVPFYDTAGSVQHLMAERLRDTAAIAGPQAAPQYGARILRRGIEDDHRNFTRFFLLRPAARPPEPGAAKTSVAFALKNIPGALFKALSVFALRDINLSRIESRPVRGRPWEYVFFVDFLRGRDAASALALRHLAELSDFVKVLGIYRAAS